MSFDINKPYRTRDGRDVSVHQPTGCCFFVGIIRGDGRHGRTWSLDGTADTGEQHTDLVNIPERRTIKVWLWLDGDGYVFCDIAEPNQNGLRKSGARALRALDVNFTIGEGLNPS